MTVTQLPPTRQPSPPAPEANPHPHRRSVLLAVLVAVIVGVLVLGAAMVAGGIGADRQASSAPAVTGSSGSSGSSVPAGEAAIPTRLAVPSSWLPVDNVPGRAAVLIPGEHETLFGTDRQGVFAVSATTGAFTWLPLPGLSDRLPNLPVLLSPDGERVAYWGGAEQAYDDPTALVVRDLTTGAVSRHIVRPGSAIDPSDLLWDRDALVYAFRIFAGERDLGGGGFEPLYDEAAPERWNPTTGEVTRGDRPSRDGSKIVRWLDGYAMTSGYGRPSIGPLAFGDETPVPVPPVSNVLDIRQLVVTPRRLLSASSGQLLSAPLPAGADGRVRNRDVETVVASRLEGFSTTEIITLTTPNQVVVRRERVRNGRKIGRVELVDVRDGRSTSLVRGAGVAVGDPDFGFEPTPSYATDLFAVPTLDRAAPPDPIDQTAVAQRLMGTFFICFIALGVLVRIRPVRRAMEFS